MAAPDPGAAGEQPEFDLRVGQVGHARARPDVGDDDRQNRRGVDPVAGCVRRPSHGQLAAEAARWRRRGRAGRCRTRRHRTRRHRTRRGHAGCRRARTSGCRTGSRSICTGPQCPGVPGGGGRGRGTSRRSRRRRAGRLVGSPPTRQEDVPAHGNQHQPSPEQDPPTPIDRPGQASNRVPHSFHGSRAGVPAGTGAPPDGPDSPQRSQRGIRGQTRALLRRVPAPGSQRPVRIGHDCDR
jgi:hypothetical protein